MAFLSKIVIAATAFAALTAARPLAIRDATSVVTETVYTTVDVPVTLWVDENGTPLSTVAQGGNFAASATPAAEQSKVEIRQTSGTCASGSPCSGDITHWDGGLGACGWDVNSNSDFQIAMPVGIMGSQSNGNPYCGKSVTVKNPTTGTTVQATVGDKCMGCTGASIDLTNALFAAVGGGCDGRCSGFQWWFN